MAEFETPYEPGIQDTTVMDFLLPYLMAGGAKGIAQIPSMAKGAYGVLKGLGTAGKVALKGTTGAVPEVKAVSEGLKALTVPEETVNVLSALGKGPSAADLIAELKAGLQNAKVKDIITLSNGTKWRFDGIQKGAKGAGEALIEHLEGPVPEGIRQGMSTTLGNLEKASVGGASTIATDIAATQALSLAEETGGATFNLTKGSLANTPHYAVSIYPERTVILKAQPTVSEIEAYISKNTDLLNNPSNSLGIWNDAKTGQTYLDVTVTLSSKEAALKLGAEKGQKAVFDLGKMKEIRISKE
jgi:hypothetical protein